MANLRICVAGAVALGWVACCAAESRVALVIGNGAYGAGQELANPPNDAMDVAACLRELDFSVTVETNLNLGGMQDAVLDFSRALKPGDVALFFYAGHGLQADGKNFLVPVGARIREAFEVASQAYEADQVLGAMEQAGARIKVMVLDCCRDNALQRSWTRGVGSRGLTLMRATRGTLIAYSTAPGQTATDGAGRNSPYSAALVRALRARPPDGLEINNVIRAASREVEEKTGQTPWVSGSASMQCFLVPPAEGKDGAAAWLADPDIKRVRDLLSQLAIALNTRDARKLRPIADPEEGIWFWSQPGLYLVPTYQFRPDHRDLCDDKQTLRAGERFFERVADTIAAALPAMGIDREPYVVPPGADDGALELQPHWASLNTDGESVTGKYLAWIELMRHYSGSGCLTEAGAAVARARVRFEFEAVVHGAVLSVVITDRGGDLRVSHVQFHYLHDA